MGGGFLGVSTFFTLSGFLITSLLVIEHETTGTIRLARFWARRARRLLPALLLAITGCLVLAVLVAQGQQAVRFQGDALSALLYVANWRFVLGDTSYAAQFSDPSLVQHFWSLAIEEQFYVLFPLLTIAVLHGARDSRRRLATAFGALLAASVVLTWVLADPQAEPSRVYYGTDTRAAEMLVGALLACLIGGRGMPVRRRTKRRVAHWGTLALALSVAGWLLVDLDTTALYRGGLAGYGVLTALVIAATYVDGPVRWVLAWRPLRALGLISYGVYLYHWPIFLWLTPARTGLDGPALLALRLAITLVLATLSYRFVEQPIRTGARIRTVAGGVLAPAAVGLLALAVLVAPVGSAGNQIVFAPASDTSSSREPAPLAGHGAAAPTVQRVLVVGDSVALTLGRGIERWGPPNGVTVVNAARYYCAVARGGAIEDFLGVGASPGCEEWTQHWTAELDRFDPDVVVVLTTIWDVSRRRRLEWGPDWVGPGDARFDRWTRAEWQAATRLLGSRGARVVWLTAPCAAEAGRSERLAYGARHYAPRLARAGVEVVDLAARVCPGGRFTDTIDGVAGARPDGLHFSDPGADAVAAWLGPQLLTPPTGR